MTFAPFVYRPLNGLHNLIAAAAAATEDLTD